MKALAALFLAAILMAAGSASAQDFTGGGFVDLRLSANSAQMAPTDGGSGKLRYGGDGQNDGTGTHIADANLYGTVQLTEDVMAFADLRYDPDQRHQVGLIESYLRYRPLSLSPWRWSVKVGAFFPPVSLENTGPGWSSVWTLTPSAINSWVGQELRTIGGEAKMEWRGEVDHFEVVGSLFGWNEPAGVAVADGGWIMSDSITGLADRVRLPNALASKFRQPPIYAQLFKEIDGRAGYYGGVTWRRDDLGSSLSVLYYDNEADPHAFDQVYAWRTHFLSVGLQTEIDDIVVMAQALTGKTAIDPEGDETYNTHFQSAYLLLGYRLGSDWRIAGRADIYATEAEDHDPGSRLSEHGEAATLALTWKPLSYLRLTAEGIVNDSWRTQRLLIHESPAQIDRQLQWNARLSF